MRVPRAVLLNLTLAAVATLAGVVLLEVGFRARAALENRRTLAEALARRPAIPPDGRVTLGQIIRLSPDARLIYELVPNLSVTFQNARVTINNDGFRGRYYPVEKPPGTVRLVGLGDSVMFGWGVDDGEDYLSLVERGLQQRYPGHAFEVINTAVPGYSTVMEVESLKRAGLRYAPDLVVLGFCGNDMNLPPFISDERDVLALDHSFVADFVRERLGQAAPAADGDFVAWHAPNTESWDGFAGDSKVKVPERYKDMVGVGPFKRALAELAALSRDRGFDVVVVFYPAAFRVRPLFQPFGFTLVDAWPAVQRLRKEQGFTDMRDSPLTLSPQDPHPSPLGHRLIARVLLKQLVASGLVERRLRGGAPLQ